MNVCLCVCLRIIVSQVKTSQRSTERPPTHTHTTLSRPVVVKQLPGPSLPKLMAQLNIDVDSGIIRISRFIYSVCPGMSQATLFSRAFVEPARISEGLAPSEIGIHNTPHQIGIRNTPLTCVMFCCFVLTLSRPVVVKQLPGPSLPKTDGIV